MLVGVVIDDEDTLSPNADICMGDTGAWRFSDFCKAITTVRFWGRTPELRGVSNPSHGEKITDRKVAGHSFIEECRFRLLLGANKEGRAERCAEMLL